MPKQPLLERRVRILENKVTKLEELPARIDAAFARFSREIDAKLEMRFRSEGEMMDERFADVYSRMDERFAEVYSRMDERFAECGARMDARFEKIDARFEKVDQRFDAVDKDMKILRERYAPSMAFLPIGDTYTMGPEDAALAGEWLGVKRIVPMHYGTFPALTGTPAQLREFCRPRGIDVVDLKPGDTVTL